MSMCQDSTTSTPPRKEIRISKDGTAVFVAGGGGALTEEGIYNTLQDPFKGKLPGS